MRQTSFSGWIHAGVLLVLVVVAYGAALANGYVWDDGYFIQGSVGFDSFGAALDRAFSPLFPDRAYVRPLPLFSLYLETLPLGRNATVTHAFNLILHAGCVLLVYMVALGQLGRAKAVSHRHVALIVAAMFAVHPALVEAVAWMSSRFDLMVTFFMLSGLAAASRIHRQVPMVLTVSTSFFLAALCKESAVVFPFVLFVFEYLRRRQETPASTPLQFLNEPRSRWLFLGLVLAGLAYLLVRHLILGNGYTSLDDQSIGLPDRLARASSGPWVYCSKTGLPWLGLSPQHTFIYDAAAWRGRYLLVAVFSVAVLGATAFLLIKGRFAGWIMVAVLAAYLPVLHLLSLTIGNNLVHERFMYFPTAVLFAGLPAFVHELRLTEKARRSLLFIATLWIVVSIVVTRSVVPLWKDELSLWEWGTRMDPLSDVAAANLIYSYLQQHRFDDMNKVYRDMEESGMPITVETLTNMGNGRQGVGDYRGALDFYQRAASGVGAVSELRLAPLYANMSVAYMMIGENEKAREALLASLHYNPRHFISIGTLYAYCDGEEVDASRFNPADMPGARKYMELMRIQLGTRSEEARANPNADASLCPAEYLRAK